MKKKEKGFKNRKSKERKINRNRTRDYKSKRKKGRFVRKDKNKSKQQLLGVRILIHLVKKLPKFIILLHNKYLVELERLSIHWEM